MSEHPYPLARLFRRLRSRNVIDEDGAEAIMALPHVFRDVDSMDYLGRDGEYAEQCSFLLSGFAFRQKLTGGGDRQILSIHLPGDILDLPNMFLRVSDHNLQMLTHGRVILIPHGALERLAHDHPDISRAMWIDAMIDASIFREWILNVGRRDARSRIAHLICEFAVRFEHAGLTDRDGDGYELPLTQEQLADAVGLTPVHVNRTLKQLGSEGLITRDRRRVRIDDWNRLIEAADFTQRYLHLDQAGPEAVVA